MVSKKVKIKDIKKLEIKAQQATPAPPLGPQVGQLGIKIMELCKQFNEATKHIEAGAPVPTVLTVYQDKSFSFIIKTLPTAYLISKKVVKTKSGSFITDKDIKEIAQIKKDDLTGLSEQARINTILGSAKSMNITIKTINDNLENANT